MTAKMRQNFYLLTGLIAAVIPILVAVGVIDTGQGESTNQIMLSLASLLGAGGAATAAKHVNVQIKEGLHDPPLAPVDQIMEALPKVLANQAQANADVDKLREAAGQLATGIAADFPVIGPIAGPVVAGVNGLAQQALDQLLPR